MNIYVKLTREFNADRNQAILSSGQAVVLHKLAVMSKDGDWILREDSMTLNSVLSVLNQHKAAYRFGAPLDIRWMSGGWSSHFEFRHNDMRIRTDFVTKPPRLSAERLEHLWSEQNDKALPFVDVPDLIELKKTNREKDYAVIGELARQLSDPKAALLQSRSARDLIRIASSHPDLVGQLSRERAVLSAVSNGQEAVETALDAERRQLIHSNEARLQAYMDAAKEWMSIWPELLSKIAGMSLFDAHEAVVNRAEGVLPFTVKGIPQ